MKLNISLRMLSFCSTYMHVLILEGPGQIHIKKEEEEEKERKSLFIRMSGFQHVGTNDRLFLDEVSFKSVTCVRFSQFFILECIQLAA